MIIDLSSPSNRQPVTGITGIQWIQSIQPYPDRIGARLQCRRKCDCVLVSHNLTFLPARRRERSGLRHAVILSLKLPGRIEHVDKDRIRIFQALLSLPVEGHVERIAGTQTALPQIISKQNRSRIWSEARVY